jgi:signal peptidase I
MAARSSFADHYVVPTGSMERARCAGDRVVVEAAYMRVPLTLMKILLRGAGAWRRDRFRCSG